jgi:hypothetical protein
MVETSIEQQEPEPDIRSLSLRINNPPDQQDQAPLSTFNNSDIATHDDGIRKPRLNSSPSVIKEKDFYLPVRPAALDLSGASSEKLEPALPALTRLRRPFGKETELEQDLSLASVPPARSASTPAYSRSRYHHQHNVDLSNVPKDKNAPSAFATAIPPPPQRLNDVGPPRPPKNIAELFAPDRKLGGDPGWTQSFVNTVKCEWCLWLLIYFLWASSLTFLRARNRLLLQSHDIPRSGRMGTPLYKTKRCRRFRIHLSLGYSAGQSVVVCN